MRRKTLRWLLVLCVVGVTLCGVKSQDNLGRRVDALDKKFKVLLKRLRGSEATVNQLRTQINSMDGGAGRFSDDPACPNNAPGFHYSAALKSCYHLEANSVMVNWTEAERICQDLHPEARLVAIETEEEQQFLATKWYKERGIATVSRFWTSGHLSTNGQWKWASRNKAVSRYDNWIPTSAHDDQRFRCLAVFSNQAYYWTDVACWVANSVTCEIRVTNGNGRN